MVELIIYIIGYIFAVIIINFAARLDRPLSLRCFIASFILSAGSWIIVILTIITLLMMHGIPFVKNFSWKKPIAKRIIIKGYNDYY